MEFFFSSKPMVDVSNLESSSGGPELTVAALPKTGEIVECGGGLQFRYRSCSNPTPRAGGKLCHGKDFKSEACNTHACKCKY